MLKRWRRIGTSIVHRNPWWSVRRDIAELPSGAEAEYFFVETPGSVMIVPIDAAGCFVCVRQYRYLNDRESLEFPGGGVRAGQDSHTAAAAELAEESAYAGDLTLIGSFNPFNGVTAEICSVFVARNLIPVLAQPDPTEDCVCEHLAPAAFEAAVQRGLIWDGMTLAAHRLYLAWQCREPM